MFNKVLKIVSSIVLICLIFTRCSTKKTNIYLGDYPDYLRTEYIANLDSIFKEIEKSKSYGRITIEGKLPKEVKSALRSKGYKVYYHFTFGGYSDTTITW